MKALLLFPSFTGTQFGSKWKKNPTVTPPLGPLYVAAAMEEAGIRVRFLDLNVERITERQFINLVVESDVIALSVMSANVHSAEQLIAIVRRADPAAKVICGGPHINLTEQLVDGSDVCFLGEADLLAGEVCRGLADGDSERLLEYGGLMVRIDQKVLKTGPPNRIDGTSLRLRPARHLVRADSYGDLVGIRLANHIAPVATSRGCPYQCAFCARQGLAPYSRRDPDDVLDEIAEIVAQGCDLLVFNEDNFTVDTERTLFILNEISRRGIRVRLLAQMRVDHVNRTMLTAFKQAGGWSIILGIESGDQEVLDYLEKGTTVEQARTAVTEANRTGLFTYGFFIIGAPVETSRHFDATIRFMISMPLDFIGVNILHFQFGSKLWLREVKAGRIRSGELAVAAGSRFGSEPRLELARRLRLCYRRFYLRPGHVFRVMRKCFRLGDAVLAKFMFRFAVRLLLPFRFFALTDGLPEFEGKER